MTGMFSASRSLAGPIPERSSNFGESIAPAASMTSRFACTVPVLAVFVRCLVSGGSRSTLLPACLYADGLFIMEQYLGDASFSHDCQIWRARRKISP